MYATKSTATQWLRPLNTVPHPRTRLVCLPHAGGTALAYRTWPKSLPADVEAFAVQYPGRQDRLAEPLVHEIGGLVTPIADALAPFAGEPLVIFGHSMGASIAYEVTVELERRHGDVVSLLIASGSRAPQEKDPQQAHLLSDTDLVEDVRRVNSAFAELLEAPDLVELLLPIIRADYRLSETYVRQDIVPVRAPVVAVGGDQDPDVSAADLRAWSAVAETFEVMTFPGGHFYLAEDESTVVRSLAARLRS